MDKRNVTEHWDGESATYYATNASGKTRAYKTQWRAYDWAYPGKGLGCDRPKSKTKKPAPKKSCPLPISTTIGTI